MYRFSERYHFQLIVTLTCLTVVRTYPLSGQSPSSAQYLSGRLDTFSIRLEPPSASKPSVGGPAGWKVLSSSSGLSRLELTSEPAPKSEGRYISIIDFSQDIRKTYYFRTETLQSGELGRKRWVKVADLPISVIDGIECSGSVWETPHGRKKPPVGEFFSRVEEWRIAGLPLHHPLLTITRVYMNGTLHTISVEVFTQLKEQKSVPPEVFQLPPPKGFWDQ